MNYRTKIATKNMDYSLRDLEVMLVFLKILIVYYQKSQQQMQEKDGKPKYLSTSRWEDFFCNVFPDSVVENPDGSKSVYALTTAKKFLVEKGYLDTLKPKGKRYVLYLLKKDKFDKIASLLGENPRDYDESLLQDIKDYIEEFDNGSKSGSKFKTSEEAFKSIGL